MQGRMAAKSEQDGVDPMTEQFTFFYGGYASQWAPSAFTIEGIAYNTAEQYMMAQKAILFGDQDALDIIMGTDNPKIQKAAGRTVKGFVKSRWETEAKLFVYRANFAKFTQNKEYLDWLISTAGTTLVEASPWDNIWGIGLAETDPRAKDRATWLGTNWLGETVTQVRDDIMGYIDYLTPVNRLGHKMVPSYTA
jgi:ribA/ribD-fused uncharacterized protein